MSEEVTTDASQEEQDFSDAALDRAAEDVTNAEEAVETVEAEGEDAEGTEGIAEETKGEAAVEAAAEEVETSKETETPAEPDDNSERSKLGRRVKGVESQIDGLQSSIEKLTSFLERKDAAPAEETEDDEEIIITKKEFKVLLKEEVNSVITERDVKSEEDQDNYEKAYLTKVDNISEDLSDEEYKEIKIEMLTNFNGVPTGDPLIDAKQNWGDAERSILRKRLASVTGEKEVKKNPLKGVPPKAPLGAGGEGAEMAKSTPAAPKLDKEAAAFAAEMGMDDEQITRALSKNASMGLVR